MSRPLAFSTLGIPGAPVDEIIALAADSGCTGVELRCAPDEPVHPGMTRDAARAIGRRFTDAGVAVLCVCSYVRVGRPDGDPAAEVLAHVEIADALGAPFVRVFGGVDGQPHAHEQAVERLGTVAGRLHDDISVLLETHDCFLTGAAVARVLAKVGSPRLGALWDLVNPWRAGEDVHTTAAALGPWLRHVQVKDAASTDDLTPVLPGHGAVPIRDALAQLDQLGYAGWLALEWERMWYPDVAPLAEALAAFRTVVRR